MSARLLREEIARSQAALQATLERAAMVRAGTLSASPEGEPRKEHGQPFHGRSRRESGRRPDHAHDSGFPPLLKRDRNFRPPIATRKDKPVSYAELTTRGRKFEYTLRDELRPWASDRVAGCGRTKVVNAAWVAGSSENVEVWTRAHDPIADGPRAEGSAARRAYYRNILTCGSAWECPSCMGRHRRAGAEKIKHAVDRWMNGHGGERAHGDGSVLMLTLTVRHGLGDDLGEVRKGVTDAFSRMISGRAWTQFRRLPDPRHCIEDVYRAKLWGNLPPYIGGYVRALEVTHGQHGWHPHVHALVFCEVPPSEESIAAMRAWFTARWRLAVRQVLGAEHEPDDVHGVDLRECHSADYISKMGLELSAPSTKAGRAKNRSPIQIAIDYATTHDLADGKLWQDYAAGMKGAKALTWSGGLLDRLGLKEEDEPEGEVEPQLVAAIDDITWHRVRDLRGAKLAILEAAEEGGADGMRRVLDELLSRAPPGYAARYRDGTVAWIT